MREKSFQVFNLDLNNLFLSNMKQHFKLFLIVCFSISFHSKCLSYKVFCGLCVGDIKSEGYIVTCSMKYLDKLNAQQEHCSNFFTPSHGKRENQVHFIQTIGLKFLPRTCISVLTFSHEVIKFQSMFCQQVQN